MKLRMLSMGLALTFSLAVTAGCGSGGGGGGNDGDGGQPIVSTPLQGVVSKGLVSGGTVRVYAVVNGVKEATPRGTATTDTNGRYSADLGNYSGPVLIEISGGSYTDEATGQKVTIPADTVFLRAANPSVVAGTPVTTAVTPLTELAVQKAGTLTAANMTAANSAVADLFNVDIINTLPVAPTTAALSGASDAQKTYTLALAAVSQMAGGATTAAVTSAIAALNSGIGSGNIMSSSTAGTFTTALTNYLSSGANTTGISASSPTVAAYTAEVGKRTVTLTFGTTGLSGKGIYGVDAVINLPSSGYSITVDPPTGIVPTTAAGGGSSAISRYRASDNTLTLGVINAQAPLGDGALATITLTVGPGFASTATITKLTDMNGAPMVITGVSPSVTIN